MLIGHRTILNSLLNPNKSRTFNLKRFYSPPIFKSTDHAFKDRNMNITESALSRLVELKQKFPESRLRLAVEAGGCHGFQYKFQLDIEEPSSEDMYPNASLSFLLFFVVHSKIPPPPPPYRSFAIKPAGHC